MRKAGAPDSTPVASATILMTRSIGCIFTNRFNTIRAAGLRATALAGEYYFAISRLESKAVFTRFIFIGFKFCGLLSPSVLSGFMWGGNNL